LSIIKNISAIKDKIIFLLENYPHLRDDDNKLIANIWHNEVSINLDAKSFLSLLAKGKLTNTETIRRCRQKVQEQHPELRGTKYKYRQDLKTEVGKQINLL